MARQVTVKEYRSDYTGEPRYAVKVDGRYPPELDFETREEAEAAAERVRAPRIPAVQRLDQASLVGAYVKPDGWRFGGSVVPGGEYPIRLQGERAPYAVRIEQTGRYVRRVPGEGGSLGLRVRITFLGDGEPDTVVGGWLFTG